MESFYFIANTVLPVFLIIVLGYFLSRLRLLTSEFNKVSSKFVFTVALPCMLFNDVSGVKIGEVMNISLAMYLMAATICSFGISWLTAIMFKINGTTKGAFIQGSFRGNYVIIGLAMLTSLNKTGLLTKGAVVLLFIVPLYNVLSIIALAVNTHTGKSPSAAKVLKEIASNPMIIALAVAIVFSVFGLALPAPVQKSMTILSGVTLPLALVGIGASLAENKLSAIAPAAYGAALMKVLFFPLLLTGTGYYLGFPADDILVMFILFSAPTAVLSFVMADAMGSDSALSGAIIFISTLLSMFTISAGLLLLKLEGMI